MWNRVSDWMDWDLVFLMGIAMVGIVIMIGSTVLALSLIGAQ